MLAFKPAKYVARLVALGFVEETAMDAVHELGEASLETVILFLLQRYGPSCLRKNVADIKKDIRRKRHIFPSQKDKDKAIFASVLCAHPHLFNSGHSSGEVQRALTFPSRRPSFSL